MSKPFQQIQLEFAQWLREETTQEKGFGSIEPRRTAIYKRLIHANIEQFIDSGFPVLRKTLDDAHWQQLKRDFIAQHRAQSPLFSDIGREFLNFLVAEQQLLSEYPDWLFELAQYERMEVDVQFADLESKYRPLDSFDAATPLYLNPTAQVGIFDYPVAQISSSFRPDKKLATPYFVLVYQNQHGKVQFIELNSLTALALDMLQQQPLNLQQLSEALSDQLPNFTIEQLYEGFAAIAADFAERFVLLDKS
ncbi:hypothetical protein PSI9734_00246 [Pseudidiomarina piscicola]|uniref:Uncharacterized protein n=1 Tax=Pseudidiomarina piscicola TaxID=2614830 RepID=A0A6S6WPU2_9GAMM|nr:putative DNA-binding domain-containing protein [Pseudidiomarina piscicola]CAB0149671.1 hypothetical protein PSI9734_00246 [Pseudidiomarina piscicola]VZT39120.1 hypothetical protein PSI9734_00246 [Pseudomonas aeruginosa]